MCEFCKSKDAKISNLLKKLQNMEEEIDWHQNRMRDTSELMRMSTEAMKDQRNRIKELEHENRLLDKQSRKGFKMLYPDYINPYMKVV